MSRLNPWDEEEERRRPRGPAARTASLRPVERHRPVRGPPAAAAQRAARRPCADAGDARAPAPRCRRRRLRPSHAGGHDRCVASDSLDDPRGTALIRPTISYASVPAHAGRALPRWICWLPCRPMTTTGLPARTGSVPAVEQDLIHRDRAGNAQRRAPPTRHGHRSSTATVGSRPHSPRAQSRSSRRGVKAVPMSVGHRLAGGQSLDSDRDDSRQPREGGAQTEVGADAGCRFDAGRLRSRAAPDRSARPDTRSLPRCSPREAGWAEHPRPRPPRPPEPLELALGGHLVLLGPGEVGPHPFDREPGRGDRPPTNLASPSSGGHTPIRCGASRCPPLRAPRLLRIAPRSRPQPSPATGASPSGVHSVGVSQ